MKSESDILEQVNNIITDKGCMPIKFKTIVSKLELNREEENILSKIIEDLINKGVILKVREGKYSTPQLEGLIVGEFRANEKGFGFVLTNSTEMRDIFISPKMMKDALDKDKVLCEIVKRATDSKLPEGKILRVIERGASTFVGTYDKSNRGYGFVIADSNKMKNDIFISEKNSKGAVSGEKVKVKIIKYEDEKSPEGEILEILGHKDDPGVDVLSIIKEYDVPTEFSEEVKEELNSIPDEVDEIDKVGRFDARSFLTVTIDGEDTKDIDDAISLEKLSNGNYKLGVHIADVTNYVKEGTELDKEAYTRGNSIYIVDRVIPMLPHKLSNGICSLNQGVDRLALSCIMEIDNTGKVVNYDICESLINVNKRMTYTEVQKGLDKDPETLIEDKEFIEMFGLMEELQKILYDKRLKRGALEFITEECKIYLDEKGKVSEIKKYDRNFATTIIEEFMLVCNETIAEEYSYLELPFVYRTHESPDEEKLEYLIELIRAMGIPVKLSEDLHPKELQKILEELKGKDEEKMLSKLMLRSMKQARYTPTNDGHFGLAAKFYCHFTSPIRRYPDLMIHRIIKENIETGISEDRYNFLKFKTIEVSENSSITERKAEEIEREVEDYKKCEYMQDFIDEEFDGIVSGVTGWGVYVELDNTVEGLVRISSLSESYVFDEKKHMLIGERTNSRFTLGQSVRIKVIKVDLNARTIDFEFVQKIQED